MHEGEAHGVLAAGAREADGLCLAERLERRALLHARRTRQHGQLELAAHHREQAQDAPAARRKPLELPAQHVAHALGYGQTVAELCDVELALGGELGQLRNEQRVARRGREHRLDHRRRWHLGRRALEQEADRLAPQALQVDALDECVPGAGREHARKGPLRPRRIAERADQMDACAEQRGHHGVEQQQSRLVGPVQVVDHEQERLRLADALQEQRHGVEEAEADLGAIEVAVLGHLAGQRELGDPGELVQLGVDLLRDGRGALGREQSAHDLQPRPERRRAFAVEAAADLDIETARLAFARQLGREPRLADAGGAGDERHPRLAARRGRERRAQRGHGVVAIDEVGRGPLGGPGYRQRAGAKSRRDATHRAGLGGRGCAGLGLRARHLRDEADALAADRLDRALGRVGVAEHAAQVAQRAPQRQVADANVGPEHLEQLRLGHDSIAMPHQVDEQSQRLRWIRTGTPRCHSSVPDSSS